MHDSVRDWVASQVEALDMADAMVLEVGSRDENGTVRALFAPGSYVGCDMREGPNVDFVWDATKPPGGLSSPFRWDAVLCLEMLEHCSRPWLAVEHMAELLKPGGHLLLTTRGFESGHFPVHGYPDDYYRYSLGAVEVLFREAGLTTQQIAQDPQFPGLLAVAVKP